MLPTVISRANSCGGVGLVITPLISLARDQVLRLTRRGVSACLLGSGQADASVERRALAGEHSPYTPTPTLTLSLTLTLTLSLTLTLTLSLTRWLRSARTARAIGGGATRAAAVSSW